MSDLRKWLRRWPSGHVHYCVGQGTENVAGAKRWFACGRVVSVYGLTDTYPPRARRCRACEDAHDPNGDCREACCQRYWDAA